MDGTAINASESNTRNINKPERTNFNNIMNIENQTPPTPPAISGSTKKNRFVALVHADALLGGKLGITSVQIADELEKQHAHVIRKIEQAVARSKSGAGSGIVETIYTDTNNQKRKMYILDRNKAAKVMSSLDDDYFDEIMEAFDMAMAAIPRALSPIELARANMLGWEQAEAEKQLAIVAKDVAIAERDESRAIVAITQPKADIYDEMVPDGTLLTMSDAVRKSGLSMRGIGTTTAMAALREKNYIIHGKLVTTQKAHNQEVFKTCTVSFTKANGTVGYRDQVFVTKENGVDCLKRIFKDGKLHDKLFKPTEFKLWYLRSGTQPRKATMAEIEGVRARHIPGVNYSMKLPDGTWSEWEPLLRAA